MKTTLEELYQRWKRPLSSYEGVVMTDYAYAEDSYTFKEYALIHKFTESEIDAYIDAMQKKEAD